MHSTHHPKRLAAVVAVATAVALSIAGCSAGSSSGPTKISLSMQNPNVKTADPATWAIVQAFEKKYPNISVTVTGQPVAQHLQAISVAAQSHTLPDIFWVYKSTAEQMNKAGDLMDLAPVLKSLGLTDKIASSTLDNFSTGKVTYGVPYQGLLTGIWYNKKILSDNGLTVPKTFDDFVNVAKTLHSKGITTLSDGANQSSFSVWSFLVDLDRYGWESKEASILAGTVQLRQPGLHQLLRQHRQAPQSGSLPVERDDADLPAGGQRVHQRQGGDAGCGHLGFQRHPGFIGGTRRRLLERADLLRRRWQAGHRHERRLGPVRGQR